MTNDHTRSKGRGLKKLGGRGTHEYTIDVGNDEKTEENKISFDMFSSVLPLVAKLHEASTGTDRVGGELLTLAHDFRAQGHRIALSPLQEEYQAYFREKLEAHGLTGISGGDAEALAKFFNDVRGGWNRGKGRKSSDGKNAQPYSEFFRQKMKEHGLENISGESEEKLKAFFDDVEKGWAKEAGTRISSTDSAAVVMQRVIDRALEISRETDTDMGASDFRETWQDLMDEAFSQVNTGYFRSRRDLTKAHKADLNQMEEQMRENLRRGSSKETGRIGDYATWGGKKVMIVDTHGYPVKTVDIRWTESGVPGSKNEVSGHKRKVPVGQLKLAGEYAQRVASSGLIFDIRYIDDNADRADELVVRDRKFRDWGHLARFCSSLEDDGYRIISLH